MSSVSLQPSQGVLDIWLQGQAQDVWLEITRTAHGHGGPGWEYGHCLWCPARNRLGADYYGIIRELEPGDLVIHILENVWPDGSREKRFHGVSLVERGAVLVEHEPPLPGPWRGMGSYYRVALRGFIPFPKPLSVERFLEDFGDDVCHPNPRPDHYPFVEQSGGLRRLSQGMYIARCTGDLFFYLGLALGLETGEPAAVYPPVPQKSDGPGALPLSPGIHQSVPELGSSAVRELAAALVRGDITPESFSTALRACLKEEITRTLPSPEEERALREQERDLLNQQAQIAIRLQELHSRLGLRDKVDEEVDKSVSAIRAAIIPPR